MTDIGIANLEILDRPFVHMRDAFRPVLAKFATLTLHVHELQAGMRMPLDFTHSFFHRCGYLTAK